MSRLFTAIMVRRIAIFALVAVFACEAAAAEGIKITQVEPTAIFPRVAAGEPLRQLARLGIDNQGPAVEASVRMALLGRPICEESLGQVEPGASVKDIHIPDIAKPAELRIELYRQGIAQAVDSKTISWQPQRKWNIYCVSYSHHDLGYEYYPHRVRTDVRHGNIAGPLRFCDETDGWNHDDQFRFMIETSEPITSFLGSHSAADAARLARRVQQGRIQIGALHNTANTEQLGHECLARLFYLTNRHSRDLLGIPASRTAQIDDVIGLTWPLATFCMEAGVPYFFHGYNACAACLQPASDEAVFYWRGPDAEQRRPVMVRSVPYSMDPIARDRSYGRPDPNAPAVCDPRVIEELIAKYASHNWPYDAILSQDGSDFSLVTRKNADRIRHWNGQYAFPHLVCATMDMFFDAVVKQADPAKIKTFAKDGNNQWADQDANDAWLLGQARRQGEAIPTAEKLATVAQVVTGEGYPWTDVYQAYHRQLAYHEHTNAADSVKPELERMLRYETELAENREMIAESAEFSRRALDGALDRLAGAITTDAERNLLVFNPLLRSRTDVVCVDGKDFERGFRLVDPATGSEVPQQRFADGTIRFVAPDVPSLGYKTFAIQSPAAGTPEDTGGEMEGTAKSQESGREVQVENRFYRVQFSPVNGTITSIKDKELDTELVDQTAAEHFNAYLYERFETPDPKVGSQWYRVESATVSVAKGRVADVVTVRASAAGVDRLEQQVILYRDIRRIDFVLNMVKSPSGRDSSMSGSSLKNKESAYVALPFAVPDYRFHHELPGCVAEPIKDQFEGSCTAFYVVRHFSDVSNNRYGVTVSPIDSSLVEYGRPRSCPLPTTGAGHNYSDFEKVMEYPRNSRMYLYLLDNMFICNARWDQRGPMSLCWSIRSHKGDWRDGRADEFGWDVHNPLIARLALGKKKGSLPPVGSFANVDQPNVACTTIKPAEANGAGIILRFVETQGRATTATVLLPFLGTINSANGTSLTEDDQQETLAIRDGQRITFRIEPFDVKTIRVQRFPSPPLSMITAVQAEPIADMETKLSWQADSSATQRISHYRVYRGTTPDFQPGLLTLIGQPVAAGYHDRPQLNYGGWINNRLEPNTTYYYRVSMVDRWNNEGPASAAVSVATLRSAEKNLTPLPVECLRAIVVSPIAPFNCVNLLWRTSCESDVRRYEVHRSTQAGFMPGESSRIGIADADAMIKGSGKYGNVTVDRLAGDYDHMMFLDAAVEAATTYYYRVCAIDAAGQKGPCSQEAQATTKAP